MRLRASTQVSGLSIVLGLVSIAGCGSSAPAPTPTAVSTAVKAGGAVTRRDVKTASDPDASKIDLTPKDTSIEDIDAQKLPSGKLAGRVGPFETSTWRVSAKLESIRLMKDHDFYIVMKGAKGGQTVVEVPDPNECKNSPLEPQIAAARKELDDRYHPTTNVQPIHDDATVTGVGFLGFGGAKKPGKQGSGPRLMPGLGFDFGKKG